MKRSSSPPVFLLCTASHLSTYVSHIPAHLVACFVERLFSKAQYQTIRGKPGSLVVETELRIRRASFCFVLNMFMPNLNKALSSGH